MDENENISEGAEITHNTQQPLWGSIGKPVLESPMRHFRFHPRPTTQHFCSWVNISRRALGQKKSDGISFYQQKMYKATQMAL